MRGKKKKTFSSCSTFLLLLRLYRSYRDTHPFVEEGHEAIAFWFPCGHVFDHPTVPADTNPVCGIVKCDGCRVTQTDWKSNTYEIFPKGPKAALMSSVVISGLRSPTKTWKWPEANEYWQCWSDKQHINPAAFPHRTLNIYTGLIIKNRRGQIISPGSPEHICWRKHHQDYRDYGRTADLDDQQFIKVAGNVWNRFGFKYVLLVSFFWLVGVVAQLTLTSCKRERVAESKKRKGEIQNATQKTEEGSFSLIRGWGQTPGLLRFCDRELHLNVVSVCQDFHKPPLKMQ